MYKINVYIYVDIIQRESTYPQKKKNNNKTIYCREQYKFEIKILIFLHNIVNYVKKDKVFYKSVNLKNSYTHHMFWAIILL